MSDGWHFCKVDVNDLSQFFLYIFHFTVALLPFSNWSGHHYGSHFFRIFILWEKRRICIHFLWNLLIVKNSWQGFSHFLYVFGEYARKIMELWKNHHNFPKFGQKWRKFIFCFSFPPHFSVKYKEMKKKEIFQILAYCVMLQHTSTI